MERICHPHLTMTPPEHATTAPGMAFFAGMGPLGKTCGDCKFRGYHRERKPKFDAYTGQDVIQQYRYQGCEKYRQMTGICGPVIDGDLRACKYFEDAPK